MNIIIKSCIFFRSHKHLHVCVLFVLWWNIHVSTMPHWGYKHDCFYPWLLLKIQNDFNVSYCDFVTIDGWWKFKNILLWCQNLKNYFTCTVLVQVMDSYMLLVLSFNYIIYCREISHGSYHQQPVDDIILWGTCTCILIRMNVQLYELVLIHM